MPDNWTSYSGNLHIHTRYSDGEKLHAEIAHDAIVAGLDFIVVTDHNVYVTGVEGYYENGSGQRVLLMTCLLYTSPSPRDRTRSRMPSSA